jgi:hypothetical protein
VDVELADGVGEPAGRTEAAAEATALAGALWDWLDAAEAD